MSCFEKGCKDDVVIKCFCSKTPVFSCKLHMAFHMLTKTEEPHSFEQIVLNVSKEKKIELIKRILEAIEDLKEYQRDVLKTVSTLVNEISSNAYKIESEIFQIISILRAYTEKIIASAEYSTNDYFGKILHNNINLREESKLWTASSIFKTLKENSIINFESHSHEIYKRLKASNELFLGETQRSNTNDIFCLYRKLNEESYIIKLNMLSYEIEEIPILLRDVIIRPIVCGLPDNKLFIGGGSTDLNLSDMYYIIDSNERNIQSSFTGNHITHFSGVIYYNELIYIFGGKIGGSMISDSQYFNLKKNIWQSISPLTSPSSLSCPIVYNHNIILASYHWDYFLCYSPKANNYSKIYFNAQSKSSKNLFTYNNIVYMIYQNKIFQAKNGLYDWDEICDFKFPNRWSIREYIEYNEKVYLRNDLNIFVFDPKTLTIYCIYDIDYSKKI